MRNRNLDNGKEHKPLIYVRKKGFFRERFHIKEDFLNLFTVIRPIEGTIIKEVSLIDNTHFKTYLYESEKNCVKVFYTFIPSRRFRKMR